jgi:acetylornithine deacetylase/succinyl-diaminopimelate desuccinylase-like protein
MAATPLRDEAVELLRELLRLDTVNPPGNETRAAELLRAYLEEAGVECELLARDPARANLVARIPGGDGKRLLLLGHTDTVLADPEEWTVDPWSGALRDGHVWGRGALDMKSQVAANAVAVATLAREGYRPPGDIILAATADEEVGTSDFGVSWLCREHPDAIHAEYCLNEGGGDRVTVNGRVFYLCAVAEKMSSPFRLRVRGRSGHASIPAVSDNALVKAARLVDRLSQLRPPRVFLPETEAFVTALVGTLPGAASFEDRLAALDESLEAMVEPMIGMTVVPTMVEASRKRNVVPALCDVTCDCRLVPGQTQDEAEAVLRAWLGEDGWELEWLEGVGGSRSSAHTPLWEAIAAWVAREEPGAEVVPTLLPGFTDSHYLREAFGTIAYGFFPLRTMDAELASRLVHSADERIAVDDLELGTRFVLDMARTITAGV